MCLRASVNAGTRAIVYQNVHACVSMRAVVQLSASMCACVFYVVYLICAIM